MNRAELRFASVFPVARQKNWWKHCLVLQLRAGKPGSLGDVFRLCFRCCDGKRTATILADVPELADAELWFKQLLDVEEPVRFNFEAGFFPSLSHRCGGQRFLTLDTTARRNPEVVSTWPHMAYQEDLAFGFNEDAGGQTVLHCAA